ncbi:MAG: glycosyltransferase family 39 protein, partial [Phycisphaerae bacterium]|nr:glycosyltransferase family 39 protein [Phycisphaerae bacterium]
MTGTAGGEKLLGDTSGGWLGDFPPRRWHLALAAACVAVVYLAGVTNLWWPTSDSALYLSLARSIVNGEGYQFNGMPHSHVTPGLPLALAGLRWLFGPGYWVPNLFVALCGMACLWLVYATITRLSDRRMALAIALTTAFSYAFYFIGHRILTDMPFILLFWAVAYAGLRSARGSAWWIVAACVFVVFGITVRAPGMLLLGPLAVGLALERCSNARFGRRVLVGGAVLAAVAVTAIIFYLIA